jgi:hypothetical protein
VMLNDDVKKKRLPSKAQGQFSLQIICVS